VFTGNISWTFYSSGGKWIWSKHIGKLDSIIYMGYTDGITMYIYVLWYGDKYHGVLQGGKYRISKRQMSIYLFIYGRLGFEFRALCLLGRYSTGWVTPPAVFARVIFAIVLLFAWACLDCNPPTFASCHKWDDRCIPPCSAFSVEMGSYKLFFLGLTWNHDFSWFQPPVHLGWQFCTTMPIHWWEGGLMKFYLAGLKLQSSWSDPSE
jgi:hypothetical protein